MAARPRSVVYAVPVVLVVAVVLAVFLLGGNDGGDAPDAAPGPTTASPSPTAPPPDAKADPDTWCTAFRAFADAQSQYVAAPDDPTAQADLQARADALLGLGQPLGLSDGGNVALQVLVDSALEQADDPTLAPGSATQDDKALFDYLGASCPA